MSTLDAADIAEIRDLLASMDYAKQSRGGFEQWQINMLSDLWDNFYSIWYLRGSKGGSDGS